MALALVSVSARLGEPVYWWVTTERVEISGRMDGHPVKGSVRVKRRIGGGERLFLEGFPDFPELLGSTLHGRFDAYYTENGYRYVEGWWESGEPILVTFWHIEGGVLFQWDGNKSLGRPPWLGNVTDQTEPTAPWWKGGE